MKIGIITLQGSYNYGATLQTYALQKYIASLGHDCEIINLLRNGFKGYIPSNRFKPIKTKKTEHFLIRFAKKLFPIEKTQRTQFPKKDELVDKMRYFMDAIPGTRIYKCIDDLYKNVPQYDIYVTGSDQVWNPYRGDCVEPFFLTFAPQGAKCISYAASLGVSRIGQDVKFKYTEWLKRYQAISVRETSAQSIIQELTSTTVERVLDPTFLLKKEDWLNLAKCPQREKPYILLYTLMYDSNLLCYAQKVSEESGLELLYLTQRQPKTPIGRYISINDAGFEDFIGYINDAEMMITNSFHGTVFALQTNCNNIFTYPSIPRRISRIKDIYALLDIEGHILHEDLHETYSELKQRTLDRAHIESILFREANASRDFLISQLK